MAGEQRHAAEDAVVIADQFIVVMIVAAVARIETEASNFIECHRAHEILPHTRRAATGNTATALDAAVELIDFFRELRLHSFFQFVEIDFGLLDVKPRLDPLAHTAHPLPGVDRKIGDQLEDRQGASVISESMSLVNVRQARAGRPLIIMPQLPQMPARQTKSN